MLENRLIDPQSPLTATPAKEERGGQPAEPRRSRRRTVLLVEPRDEVFARLAADITAAGIRVDRALSAAEASRRYALRRPHLMVAEVDLPDESAWLFAGKLRVADPGARIWIYTPWSSAVEVAMANFVGADELIEYGGDLWRLAAELLDRLGATADPPTWPVEDPRRPFPVPAVA
jgi:ActR/RegA family two-component response regulator